MRAFAIAALLASVSAVPASAAVFVNFTPASGVTGNFTLVDDLESLTPGTEIGTGGFVYADSVDGVAARPAFGSTGNFGAVLAGGTVTAFFSNLDPNGFAAVGFVLGSLDTYNTLTIGFADGTSQEYVGGQIINDLTFPSGDQIVGETNGFVTFRSDGSRIVTLTLTSSQNSFEFDNFAVGAIPEPATWAMMIGGMGVVGGALRRRKVTTAFA